MSAPVVAGSIVILDFGGQYAHLIASRIRRFGFKSYIFPSDVALSSLKNAAGIILSGGPQSVYDKGSPTADPRLFELGIPVLALCYGHQWVAQALGGKVTPATVKEYGKTEIKVVQPKGSLFEGLSTTLTVWMSHGDEVSVLPPGFETVASSKDCVNAAMMDLKRKIFAIQFHVEVTHTQHGMDLLRRFVDICRPESWTVDSYGERIAEEVKKEVGDQPSSAAGGLRPAGRKVFMLVSGGVDSTVAFTLLNKVLGPSRVQGLLVDTGLMRKDEIKDIQKAFEPLGIKNLHVEDASERFFKALKGAYDPEQKRAIIGQTFLDVQKEVSERMGLGTIGSPSTRSARSGQSPAGDWMLGQGTIYPDTIETGGTKNADKIKTHHNRVEMVQRMIEEGLVIEPLKELYKDEVRQLGEELGLPHDLVWRHPFPGPGLGVRILCAEKPNELMSSGIAAPHMVLPVKSVGVQGDGRTYRHAIAFFSKEHYPDASHYDLATSIPNANREISRVLLCTSHAEPFDPVFTPTFITRDVADLLRDADAIVRDEIKGELSAKIWQFPVVLLPFGTREEGHSIVLRPIDSTDAMTAEAFRLPPKILSSMTRKILAVSGIDAVFLDLTNKPPATIEWE